MGARFDGPWMFPSNRKPERPITKLQLVKRYRSGLWSRFLLGFGVAFGARVDPGRRNCHQPKPNFVLCSNSAHWSELVADPHSRVGTSRFDLRSLCNTGIRERTKRTFANPV